jgi:hypothetical protein
VTGEADVQSEILDALGRIGVWAFRVNSGGRVGRVRLAPRGTPDICVVDPPGWIEVKRPGRYQSNPETKKAQEQWRTRALERGVRLVQVQSVREAIDAVVKWRR